MGPLIWLAVLSCGLSLLLTPALRDIFLSLGLVDEPDQLRKTHKLAVPRIGGIAIGASYVASIFIVQWFTHALGPHMMLVVKILPAAATIFAVGIIDDIWGLSAKQKLAGQILAAGIACWSGVLAVDVM